MKNWRIFTSDCKQLSSISSSSFAPLQHFIAAETFVSLKPSPLFDTIKMHPRGMIAAALTVVSSVFNTLMSYCAILSFWPDFQVWSMG